MPHKDRVKAREYSRQYYRTHKEQVREYFRQYRQTHKEQRREEHKQYYQRHKEQRSAYAAKRYDEVRNTILSTLGAKCSKCGYEADRRALQIDHVNGGGTQAKRERGMVGELQYILKHIDSGEYQVLCGNCHAIKTYEDKKRYWNEQAREDKPGAHRRTASNAVPGLSENARVDSQARGQAKDR